MNGTDMAEKPTPTLETLEKTEVQIAALLHLTSLWQGLAENQYRQNLQKEAPPPVKTIPAKEYWQKRLSETTAVYTALRTFLEELLQQGTASVPATPAGLSKLLNHPSLEAACQGFSERRLKLHAKQILQERFLGAAADQVVADACGGHNQRILPDNASDEYVDEILDYQGHVEKALEQLLNIH